MTEYREDRLALRPFRLPRFGFPSVQRQFGEAVTANSPPRRSFGQEIQIPIGFVQGCWLDDRGGPWQPPTRNYLDPWRRIVGNAAPLTLPIALPPAALRMGYQSLSGEAVYQHARGTYREAVRWYPGERTTRAAPDAMVEVIAPLTPNRVHITSLTGDGRRLMQREAAVANCAFSRSAVCPSPVSVGGQHQGQFYYDQYPLMVRPVSIPVWTGPGQSVNPLLRRTVYMGASSPTTIPRVSDHPRSPSSPGPIPYLDIESVNAADLGSAPSPVHAQSPPRRRRRIHPRAQSEATTDFIEEMCCPAAEAVEREGNQEQNAHTARELRSVGLDPANMMTVVEGTQPGHSYAVPTPYGVATPMTMWPRSVSVSRLTPFPADLRPGSRSGG